MGWGRSISADVCHLGDLKLHRAHTQPSPSCSSSSVAFILRTLQCWKSNWSPPSLPIWMSIIKSSISKRCCKGSMLQILQVCDCPWYLLQIYMIWYDMQLCTYDTQTCNIAINFFVTWKNIWHVADSLSVQLSTIGRELATCQNSVIFANAKITLDFKICAVNTMFSKQTHWSSQHLKVSAA